MTTLLRVFLSVVLLSLLGNTSLARDLRVVVNASATEEYMERAKDKPYHTYHVYKGNYFGGQKRDNTLRAVSFEDVTETVAEFLKEKNFYPAAHKDGGDQLILITWGNTLQDMDYREAMNINEWSFTGINALASGDGPEAAMAADQAASINLMGPGAYWKNLNTRMLGYDKGLFGSSTSQIQKEKLTYELSEDRYFFVLNAFDLPHMRKTNEIKELWSCRVSVRNRGTNFSDALQMMGTIAAPTFGTNLDSLVQARVDPDAEVIFGKLEVIGEETTNLEDE